MSIVGSLINGVSSLIGGAKDRQTQEKINQQNIEFQKETNKENRDFQNSQLFKQYMYNQNMAYQAQNFQEYMYEKQREDNSMKEMFRQAQEAGINPFALFDSQGYQGGSISGVPQASGVTPNAVPLQAPHAEMIQGSYQRSFENFSKMAQSLASLSQMGLNNAQKTQIFELLKPQVELLQKQAETEEEKATALQIQNNLDAFFGFMDRNKKFEELSQKVENLIKEGTLTDRKITREDFEIKMQDVEEELRKTQKDIKKKDYQKAEFYVNNMRRDFESMIDLRKAQTKSANASANESNANAATTNALRPYEVRLKGALSRLNESDAAFKEETFVTRYNMLLDDMEKNGISVNTMREALKKAQKENDAFWLKLILENAVNISNSGAKWADSVIPF